MQTKKILAIALVAALAGSTAVVMTTTAAAVDVTYGLVGTMTGWSDGADIAMTDIGNGVFEGSFTVGAGDHEFKIRTNGSWDEDDENGLGSWACYEEEYDRTKNSQTNCKISVDEETTVTVQLDTSGDDMITWPVSYKLNDGEWVYTGKPAEATIYGLVGSMTGWADGADIPMYDKGNGIVEGSFTVDAGDYEFKIRTNGSWDEDDENGFGSWACYEEEYDRTKNSQTNCKISVDETTTVTVQLDTSGDDMITWPVSYKLNDGEWVYTGKEQESQESSEEPSQEPSQEPSEEPSEEPSQEPSLPEVTVTTRDMYIYFDNSETKWDEVYAYWWHPDYARTYDFEDNDYGYVQEVDAEGNPASHPVAFPGTKMTQVPGTDVWQARVPFNAQKIIFGSGKSDAQIEAGEIGYQTGDLNFDPIANAGQIYVVDMATPAKAGRGVEKTKFKYNAGEWKAYDGEFISEVLAEDVSVVEPSDEPVTSDTTSTDTSTPTQTSTTPTPVNPTDNVKTGDATMPIAVASVAVAALGVVFFAAKKKKAE